MSHAQSLRIPSHLRLLLDEAKAIWHGLLGNIFSSYRPELHYMRGPGPKWHEKRRHEFGFIEFCGRRDAASRFLLGLDEFNDNAVMKRPKLHRIPPKSFANGLESVGITRTDGPHQCKTNTADSIA